MGVSCIDRGRSVVRARFHIDVADRTEKPMTNLGMKVVGTVYRVTQRNGYEHSTTYLHYRVYDSLEIAATVVTDLSQGLVCHPAEKNRFGDYWWLNEKGEFSIQEIEVYGHDA